MASPDTLRGQCFKVEYDVEENMYVCPICTNILDDNQNQCDQCGVWLDWINE